MMYIKNKDNYGWVYFPAKPAFILVSIQEFPYLLGKLCDNVNESVLLGNPSQKTHGLWVTEYIKK